MEKLSNSCSLKCLANNCKPNGNPSLLLPTGNEIAGTPVNDACTVNIVDNGSELTYDQGDIGCVFIDCNWHQ